LYFCRDGAAIKNVRDDKILVVKLKDWRRIAIRYDRCAYIFHSAIPLALALVSWL